MTFIPINLDDAVEPQPAPAGRYELQITACQEAKTGERSKNPGSPQLRVTLGFSDEPNVPNLTHFISLPNEHDEPNSAQFKALMLKRFLHLFDTPYNSEGIDTEQICYALIGQSTAAEVTLSEPDENGNIYNRLLIPRLRGEAGRGR